MVNLEVRHLKRKLVHSEKFTDVSEVKASDEDGFLIRNLTITANSKIVK